MWLLLFCFSDYKCRKVKNRDLKLKKTVAASPAEAIGDRGAPSHTGNPDMACRGPGGGRRGRRQQQASFRSLRLLKG